MLLILFDRLISRTRSVTDLFADHSDLMESNGKHRRHLETPKLCLLLLAKIKLCHKCAMCSILWLGGMRSCVNDTKYEDKEGE